MHMLGSSVLLAYACYDLCALSTYNMSVPAGLTPDMVGRWTPAARIMTGQP
jgi:hypothetical protein